MTMDVARTTPNIGGLPLDEWHGYIIIQRITANLSENNWVDVVELVRQIVVNQASNHPEYELQERGSPDTFLSNGDTYSNLYIYEGYFRENTVDFERFRLKLVNAFGVADNTVDYTTGTQTIKDRPSIFATYRYNILTTPLNRMRVGLFGCLNEDTLCTWDESRIEALQYIIDNGWDTE